MEKKYEDWDKLIEENLENETNRTQNNTKTLVPSGSEHNKTPKYFSIFGGLILLIIIFIVSTSGGSGGVSGSYRLKSASFDQISTTRYEYYAIIENTSNQNETFRVTLEIYTPSGSLYDSISKIYTLQPGGSDTVRFWVTVPVGFYGSYEIIVT